MLLIDNGAFSHWKSGGTADDQYWLDYYLWAGQIMRRCPQAVCVVPDVIGGSEHENAQLLADFQGMALEPGVTAPVPSERMMPVWHMHESMDYLVYLAESFQFLGIGSSGQYAKIGTAKWHARIRRVFRKLRRVTVAGRGCRMPHVHMMRAQQQLPAYPFHSADSCNVAVNHNRWRQRQGSDNHVARMASPILGAAAASCNGQPDRESPRQLSRMLHYRGTWHMSQEVRA